MDYSKDQLSKRSDDQIRGIVGNQAMLKSYRLIQRQVEFQEEETPDTELKFKSQALKVIAAVLKERGSEIKGNSKALFNSLWERAQEMFRDDSAHIYKNMKELIVSLFDSRIADINMSAERGPGIQELGRRREEAARGWLGVHDSSRKLDPDARTMEQEREHAVKLDIGSPHEDGSANPDSHSYYGLVGGAGKAGTGDRDERIALDKYRRLCTDLSMVSMEHEKMPLAFVAVRRVGRPGNKEQKVIDATKEIRDVQLVEMHSHDEETGDRYEFRTDLNNTLRNILDILDRIDLSDPSPKNYIMIHHYLMASRVRLVFFYEMVQREMSAELFNSLFKERIIGCLMLIDQLLESCHT